jgi:hypothetical protein
MNFLDPLQRRRKKRPPADIVRAIPQLPVPKQRRLPTYKRALHRYSWDVKTWTRDERWAEAKDRWAQHGIQLSAIEHVLRQAATARMDYEDTLANDLELAKEELAYRALIRGLNQRLRGVFTWLQQYRWVVETQVIEGALTRAIVEVAEQLATLAPHAHRTFRFRGRPGEPWLPPIVVLLSKLFRSHRMGANETRRAIVEVLALAGHGDVVNLALVKRLTTKR